MKRENEEDQEEIKQEEIDQINSNLNIDNQEQKLDIIDVKKEEMLDFVSINPPKRQRRSDDEDYEVRLLISSKTAGAIIGKHGKNIQKLRSDYNAQVHVSDSKGPERVLTILSSLDTCCDVIRDGMKHCDNANVDDFELRLLMHQSFAGCVIGKSGAKIRELRDKIGCRLKVFPDVAPLSTDRVVQMLGKEDQCLNCLTEIISLVKSNNIRGVVCKYDPHNFDDYFPDKYGGYGTNENVRNASDPFGNERRAKNDRGRLNNGRGRGSGNRRNAKNNVKDHSNPLLYNAYGSNQMGAMNNNDNGDMTYNYSNFGNRIAENVSTQVTIPTVLAGYLIGRGGQQIRRIRDESNAFIHIAQPLPGSTDRIITITGAPKQIQVAQYLLQQAVQKGM